ncbi:RcnB family protein [Sphingomonas sp.]|uniref:RcnB family protein n=1 Tax=Sphingomonas sp. TaxID=28214 RepID=UPI0025DAB1A7|nr:RcnB family protein [Sphingomonas sp.]
MRNLGFACSAPLALGFALLALTATVPALADEAPPTMNDDSRVGAPPVIVARPKGAVAPAAASPAPQPVRTAPTPLPPRAVPLAVVSTPVPALRRDAPMTQRAMTLMPPRAIPPRAMPAQPPRREAELNRPDRGGPDRAATYRRPVYGYQLPQEWTGPSYYIADYDDYGLSRPASGFGWSRYYDDAVLTDQWGRIYDWRDDVNWADHDDRYAGGRDDGYRDAGYREDGYRESGRDYDDRRDRKSRGKKYDYKGRWTGRWNGGPEQTYQGAWHGTVRPHWSSDRGSYHGGSYGENYAGGYGGSSGASYGYDGGGTTVTTVVVQAAAPVMTTRTISYDVVSYVPVRKKAVRHWKPKPKCAC